MRTFVSFLFVPLLAPKHRKGKKENTPNVLPSSSSQHSNLDDEDEQDNSFSFGFGSQSANNSSQNFFASPTDGAIQFGAGGSNLDALNPAVKSMIYQLELLVKSGKIDQQTIDLYQQISQIIPANSISNYSTIVDNPSIEKIKQARAKQVITEETRKKIGESVSETRHKKSGGDFSPPP